MKLILTPVYNIIFMFDNVKIDQQMEKKMDIFKDYNDDDRQRLRWPILPSTQNRKTKISRIEHEKYRE